MSLAVSIILLKQKTLISVFTEDNCEVFGQRTAYIIISIKTRLRSIRHDFYITFGTILHPKTIPTGQTRTEKKTTNCSETI